MKEQGYHPEIHIPSEMELVDDSHNDKGQLTGKGWTQRRKYSKIGNNEPCPCGKKKKFKNCCKPA